MIPRTHWHSGLLVLTLLSALVVEAEPGKVEGVQVIAHDGAPVGTLSQQDLRAIFSMKQKFWPDGSAINVFVLNPRHPIHEQFCRNKLQLLPFQLDRAWERQVYSGIGKRPVVVLTYGQMLRQVAQTPGAIGYLPSDVETTAFPVSVRP
ncbi:hypothetical protein [Ferrimonas gelatinilytica]|uniref:PBP domain-containing protein n=1 Tax=Ferrimonas gelatinilytica TaxID=1255257 RepID=A0ABP9SF30_9GAMM